MICGLDTRARASSRQPQYQIARSSSRPSAPGGLVRSALRARAAVIAEDAYQAGEIGVMELIDAHRADLAAQREAIQRARAARDSLIELQFLGGEL